MKREELRYADKNANNRMTFNLQPSTFILSSVNLQPSTFILQRRGFTLIEILVALTIMSVMMASLYSAFFLSRKAADAVDDSLVRMQECRAMIDTLTREIESAVYKDSKSLFKVEDRDFYGKQASQLSFTSFSPLLPGLARIDYTMEENDGKLVLKKKISSAFAGSGKEKKTELIDNLESFTVEVKYNDKWVKTWDTAVTTNLPEEVRVTVKTIPKKGAAPLTVTDIARPRYGKTL